MPGGLPRHALAQRWRSVLPGHGIQGSTWGCSRPSVPASKQSCRRRRASELASFAAWDEYVPEHGADGAAVPEDSYGLAFDDPEGSECEMVDDGSDTDDYASSEPSRDAGASTSAAPGAPASKAPAPPA